MKHCHLIQHVMKSVRVNILAILLRTDILIAALSSPGRMSTPDFRSPWITLIAQTTDNASVIVDHGLAEVPLLVDVEAKVIDGPNKGYVFPGVGTCPRDDDDIDHYGGVCFVYNEIHVRVLTPVSGNGHANGAAVFTGDALYYIGGNFQASFEVQVRVRAWKAANFPGTDFSVTGIPVVAKSDDNDEVYIERAHGLGEYPSLVLVRTLLTDGFFSGYYSDSVGSTIFTPDMNHNNVAFVVYGFNDNAVRVWITTHSKGKIFSTIDGYLVDSGVATTGQVEIYAWRTHTLSPITSSSGHVGVTYNTASVAYEGFALSEHSFVKVWAEAEDGINLGYRFPAGGALAQNYQTSDVTCSYGGLVYGYSDKSIRFWSPTDDGKNGGLICVANHMGRGMNTQRSVDAGFVVSYWPLLRTLDEFQEIGSTCVKIL